MKNLLVLAAITFSLISCSAEPVESQPLNLSHGEYSSKEAIPEKVDKENTFTIKWDSNQVGPTIEVVTYTFRDCIVINKDITIYDENTKSFQVTIKDNQRFDIQIKRTETKKNPELYLAIYKGNNKQFEEFVTTYGYMLISYVTDDGNIATE